MIPCTLGNIDGGVAKTAGDKTAQTKMPDARCSRPTAGACSIYCCAGKKPDP